jgi:ABC-type nitrate/sulfonate/bicarbonate transport system substrate-binding protein
MADLRRRPGVLLGLTALLTVAACAAPAAPPPRPPPAAAGATAGGTTGTGGGTAAAPRAEPTPSPPAKVVFGNAGLEVSTQFWAGFAAMGQGFFAAEGILAEQVAMPSLPTLLQALIAGDIQVLGLPVLATAAVVAEGAPIKFVASTQEIPTVYAFAAPGIETWSDLRGKTVSPGNAPNTYFDVVFQMMLEANGLHDGDYVARYMPSNARLPALQVGQLAAAVASGSESMRARAQGLKELGAAKDYVKDNQFAGLMVVDGWARANEEALVRSLRAFRRGAAWIFDPANKAGAIRVVREAGDFDPQELESYYEELIGQKMLSRDLRPNLMGIEAQLQMAQRMGAIERIPPIEQWVDLSYLDRASR